MKYLEVPSLDPADLTSHFARWDKGTIHSGYYMQIFKTLYINHDGTNHNIQKPRRVHQKLFGVFSYYETITVFYLNPTLCE